MSEQMILVWAPVQGPQGWRSSEENQNSYTQERSLGTCLTTSWHNRQAAENPSKSPATASGTNRPGKFGNNNNNKTTPKRKPKSASVSTSQQECSEGQIQHSRHPS